MLNQVWPPQSGQWFTIPQWLNPVGFFFFFSWTPRLMSQPANCDGAERWRYEERKREKRGVHMSAYHTSPRQLKLWGRLAARNGWREGRRAGRMEERTCGNNKKMGVKMDPVMYIFFSSSLWAEEPPGGRSQGSVATLIHLVLVHYYGQDVSLFLISVSFHRSNCNKKKKKIFSPQDVFLAHRKRTDSLYVLLSHFQSCKNWTHVIPLLWATFHFYPLSSIMDISTF